MPSLAFAAAAAVPAAPAFAVRDLHLAIGGRAILDGVGFDLPAGQVTGILGPNGSGKSTLLKVLARQMQADTGSVLFEGRVLESWRSRDFARRVGYLPQQLSAAAGLTVSELVALGRYPWHGALGRFSALDAEKAEAARRITGVERFADRLVDQLSGGERQRVWIAMLIAQDAACLLLDEPISALDVAVQIEVLDLVRRLARQEGRTVAVVLHDINMAARFCDHLVALRGGRLVADGSVDDLVRADLLESIYAHPMTVIPHPETGQRIAFPR